MDTEHGSRERSNSHQSLRLSEVLANAVSAWQSSVVPVLNRISEAGAQFTASISSTIEGLRPLVEALPEMTRRQFLNFAAYGWYPDINMPFAILAEISDRFENGDPSGSALCVQYFDNELPRIESELLKEWPARAPALAEGFAAHHQGMFFVAIPAFLAQSDGIAREGLGRRAFDRQGTGRRGDRIWDLVLEAVQLPMASETPLNQPERKRGSCFEGLNRHAVMHGDPPLEYGTRVNSLQAVSYLNYVAAVARLVMDSRL